MTLFRAIYTSRPFGYDTAMLNGILADARRCNLRDDLTGALICRADIYIQYLEGPVAALRGTLARIARDDRHLEMRVHLCEAAPKRLFPDWAMLHDPALTLMWDRDAIRDNALERTTPDEVLGIFTKLSAAQVGAG